MSKYSADFLLKLFKLTSRFEKPNIERAHSHLASRMEGGLSTISLDELRVLHQIRRVIGSDDETIAFVQKNVGEDGISQSHLSIAEAEFVKPPTPEVQEVQAVSSCRKCGAALPADKTVCPNCGDKKGLRASSRATGGTGCGIVIVIAIFVAMGFGLKSCLGVFSEESRDAVRQERYENCIEAAKRKAAAACSINACDVGCQIEYMDDPLAITRCLNRCRDMSPEEQQKLCEDAQQTVLWTAIQECPR